jgi:hypothetical protein
MLALWSLSLHRCLTTGSVFIRKRGSGHPPRNGVDVPVHRRRHDGNNVSHFGLPERIVSILLLTFSLVVIHRFRKMNNNIYFFLVENKASRCGSPPSQLDDNVNS